MAGQQLWHGLAGLSGAAAVSLGAYGAHAFKPKDPYFLEARLLLFACTRPVDFDDANQPDQRNSSVGDAFSG